MFCLLLGYTVAGSKPAVPAQCPKTIASPPAAVPEVKKSFDVSRRVAVRSPQFWIAYGGFGLAITGAYGILSTG